MKTKEALASYFESATITVAWDAACRAVYTQMRPGVTLADCQMSANQGLELMIRQGGCHWLWDLRLAAPPDAAYSAWHARNWRPRARAAGLRRKAAVVAANTPLPAFLHEIHAHRQGNDVPTAYFLWLEEARNWLRAYLDE